MTETVKDEIQEAIQRLRLNDSDIMFLPDEEALTVFSSVERHFVASDKRQWWWEDFRFPSTSIQFTNQRGFEQIERIVPNKIEKVWFIVEEDQLPFYLVYEATPEVIQVIIGECYSFEYYLVAKDLSWLVCETHHDVLIGIGAEVEARMQQQIG
jgi:hypothetical protein